MYRDLTINENAILNVLFEKDFPGRDDLLRQVKQSKVKTIREYNDNWGSLEFQVDTDIIAKTDSRVPVQAMSNDIDGIPIQLFLHVVNGKIDELEIVKADNSPIIHFPKITNFKVSLFSDLKKDSKAPESNNPPSNTRK